MRLLDGQRSYQNCIKPPSITRMYCKGIIVVSTSSACLAGSSKQTLHKASCTVQDNVLKLMKARIAPHTKMRMYMMLKTQATLTSAMHAHGLPTWCSTAQTLSYKPPLLIPSS
jgi:hypothetical protein